MSTTKNSPQISIIILGGGWLAGLMTHMHNEAKSSGFDLDLATIELEGSADVYCVASGLARLIVGPKFESVNWVNTLISATKQRTILLPCSDRGMLALSKARDTLDAQGNLCLCSSHHVTNLLNDKASGFLSNIGIGVPPASGWPMFVKPRHGCSSRGAMEIGNEEQLRAYRQLFGEDCVMQRVMRGSEYSIDAFVGCDGTLVYCVPRLRKITFGGSSVSSVTVEGIGERQVVEQIMHAIGSDLRGPLTVQGFIDAESGKFLVSEVNCRIGSGIVASYAAGIPFLDVLKCELSGTKQHFRNHRSGICTYRALMDVSEA